jgi:hypothetical protein
MVKDTALDLNSPATPTGPSGFGADQAAGLRSLFGQRPPKFMVLASALDADATVRLGLGTAHSLRRKNIKTLLIDGVPLSERKDIHHLAYPVRYDIAQALANTISLKRTLVAAEENLWFTTSSRLEKTFEAKRLRLPSLADRLAEKAFPLDLVLWVTRKPKERLLPYMSRDLEQVVVASPEHSSLIAALELIHDLSIRAGGNAIPVLIAGGSDAQSGAQAFAKLESASRSLLEQPLENLGWIAASQESNASMILPVSLYARLAEKAGDDSAALA